MPLDLLTPDQIYPFILKKLKNGWLIIEGDPDALNRLEWSVYTPGTHRNADFEMIGFMPICLFLGKKTRRLQRFLKVGPDIELKDIVLVVISRPDPVTGSAEARLLCLPEGDLEERKEYVSQLARQAASLFVPEQKEALAMVRQALSIRDRRA